ncbi:F-box domain-containing protein [Pseudomassariella vexata]|uniref:F-box domain-containing protein n=1 Tax=Pseudomassariella vexata TaxID=1141098 RepID=A0A1Y2E4R1_9PEZI|nr:F-box domain-containing protein [Pseudomassariella vexata]ORY66512.1 F-box domain-containing protein [Pseudomassariella vexata]
MDPPHVTEFASQRYFEKLKQLYDVKDQPQAAQSHDGSLVAQPSTFILPIGRHPEHQSDAALKTIEKKRGNFSFRSILPTRGSSDQDARRSSTDAGKKKSLPFDQLFLALPNELKIQIIASLPLSDVLTLRLASRSWHAMVSLNELPIARYHLQHHVPAYAVRLYPTPELSSINFHYLCGIWHRLHVAAKLAYLICEWITKGIFLRVTEQQRLEFAPQRERMRRRLIPLLFTVFHFFETYRNLHIQYIEEHGHGLLKEPYTVNPIETKIMNMYDDQTLLQVHQVFPLVISSFCRRLRPPSYVGRVERSLRGYLKDKPADDVYATALCVGGLRQVERFWEIKGYNTRRGAVDNWYHSVTKEPMESMTKPRRGLLGLTRKKSSFNMKDTKDGAHTEPLPPLPTNRSRLGLVFGTSLSAGMPMGPLSREHLRLIIPDLPPLQQIWLPTAEALILDRNIVQRPQDIKRNAQVMLELIREDGTAEEDEWWYGRGAPESVRPPLEAIEEDTIE